MHDLGGEGILNPERTAFGSGRRIPKIELLFYLDLFLHVVGLVTNDEIQIF